jgi:hypothetical protein
MVMKIPKVYILTSIENSNQALKPTEEMLAAIRGSICGHAA